MKKPDPHFHGSAANLANEVFTRATKAMLETNVHRHRSGVVVDNDKLAYIAHRAIVRRCEELNEMPFHKHSMGLSVCTRGNEVSYIIWVCKPCL